MTDFKVIGRPRDTIFVLRPLNRKAKAWARTFIQTAEGYQPYLPSVVIEHRYIDAVVEGIRADGLTVEYAGG